MSEVKNIPRLRFSEFVDEWNEYTLGKISKFSKGKGVSKSDIVEDGIYPCIRYGELYTDYSEVIKSVISKTNFSDNPVFSEENDVIIPASGETSVDIATASCIQQSGIILGGDLNIIKSSINGVFLSFYLNNKRKFDIARLSQGNSVVHLYPSQLKTLKVKVPVDSEQQKISDFLTAVDKRIELLEKKKTLLETYKKGVMKKIFNQEIRFKDDNGNDFPDWEEKRLGDITNKKSSNISANSIEFNEGDFTIYGATGELKQVDFYEMEKPYISIVKDGSGVGRVNLCKPYSSVLGTLDILLNNESSDLNFVYHFLSKTSFLKYVTGSSIPHIYYRDYSKLKLSVPTIKEQVRISKFLSSIDNQIELLETQIDKSKIWKKGLLQKMFV